MASATSVIALFLMLQINIGHMAGTCKKKTMSPILMGITELKVPLYCNIGHFYDSKQVDICGKVDTTRFFINLEAGNGDIGLHLDVQFDNPENKVVISSNSRIGNTWGDPVNGRSYDVDVGDSFCIVTVAFTDGFRVYWTSGKTTDKQRQPVLGFPDHIPIGIDMKTISILGIQGEIELTQVGYTI